MKNIIYELEKTAEKLRVIQRFIEDVYNIAKISEQKDKAFEYEQAIKGINGAISYIRNDTIPWLKTTDIKK